jgi:hypothetical protein
VLTAASHDRALLCALGSPFALIDAASSSTVGGWPISANADDVSVASSYQYTKRIMFQTLNALPCRNSAGVCALWSGAVHDSKSTQKRPNSTVTDFKRQWNKIFHTFVQHPSEHQEHSASHARPRAHRRIRHIAKCRPQAIPKQLAQHGMYKFEFALHRMDKVGWSFNLDSIVALNAQ